MASEQDVRTMAVDNTRRSPMAKNLLVVSAHAADFVWRPRAPLRPCRRRRGGDVVALSYGERGESASLGEAADRGAGEGDPAREAETLRPR